jgi:hypothetical protein
MLIRIKDIKRSLACRYNLMLPYGHLPAPSLPTMNLKVGPTSTHDPDNSFHHPTFWKHTWLNKIINKLKNRSFKIAWKEEENLEKNEKIRRMSMKYMRCHQPILMLYNLPKRRKMHRKKKAYIVFKSMKGSWHPDSWRPTFLKKKLTPKRFTRHMIAVTF